MRRIEICGGIASGKTTLARLLAERLPAQAVYEDFKANPFWARFYAAPATWMEEKNFCFLVQHLGAIKEAAAQPLLVCDFAVSQDLAYAALHPQPAHAAMMAALYRHLGAPTGRPALIVHLQCAPAQQLERIRARARPEEQGIAADYLARLNEHIVQALAAFDADVPRLAIDSAQVDFAHDGAARQATAAAIMAALPADRAGP